METGPGARAQSREGGGRSCGCGGSAWSLGLRPGSLRRGDLHTGTTEGPDGAARRGLSVGPATAPSPNPQQSDGRSRGGRAAGRFAHCGAGKPGRGAGSQAGRWETLRGPAPASTCSPRAPAWPQSPLLAPTGSASPAPGRGLHVARHNSTSIIIITTTIAGPWAGRLLPSSVPSCRSAPGCRCEWPRGQFSARFSVCLSPALSCFTEDQPRRREGQERARAPLRGRCASAPVPGAGVTRNPGPVLRRSGPATGVQPPGALPPASGCPEDPPWTL